MIDFKEFGFTRLHNGQYRGQCPFRENHDSANPGAKAFFISPELGTYHCFSCKAKGGLLKLLTTRFDVSVWDALEVVNTAVLEGSETKAPKEVDLGPIDYSRPPEMFTSRGFTPRLLAKFKVGSYIDEKNREVATIPMYKNGKCIGIMYRMESPSGKLLRASDGFDKANFLYNINKDPVNIVVEGFTDCWRSASYGFYNTVALQGVAAGPYGVFYLRSKKQVLIALDNDEPGVRGALVLYYLLYRHTDVLFVPYNAPDPGDCTRQDWTEAVSNPQDFGQFSLFLSSTFEEEELTSIFRTVQKQVSHFESHLLSLVQ